MSEVERNREVEELERQYRAKEAEWKFHSDSAEKLWEEMMDLENKICRITEGENT